MTEPMRTVKLPEDLDQVPREFARRRRSTRSALLWEATKR